MRLGLKTVLATAFFIGSVVPLSIWAAYVGDQALDQEIAEVEDRHLLLARNLGRALDRYAEDAAAVFSHVVESDPEIRNSDYLATLLESLGFRHICLIDVEAGRVVSVTVTPSISRGDIRLPPLDGLVARARAALGQLVFTDVMPSPSGDPAVYLLRNLDGGILALGELGTGYLQATQGAVAFGEGGHAAIVDASGNVLGHPHRDWVLEMRNLSQVDAVRRMMNGETGVSTFFSPAAELDMIAGFTVVPSTGWGVMIPQPLRELEARADKVARSAFALAAVLAAVCGLIGWLVGGFVSRPISAVSAAADRLAEGDTDARVPEPRGVVPLEVDRLTRRYNDMADAVAEARDAQRLALRAAEEAAEAKAGFLARITHELRTPLNSVIGFSGMIRDESLGPVGKPEYVDYARLIHESGGRLLEMVNDIIAFTRIEGRAERLSEDRVDLLDTVNSVIEAALPQSETAGVALVAGDAPPLPPIWADETKLRQAITHIVANAIKFTPGGGEVRVTLGLTEKGAAEITVTDTGIGMDEKDIPTALRPFGQLSADLSREHEGAGLGLPLANMLIEMHGGGMRVRSAPGKGTSVTLTLPSERVGGRPL
jgi:signal transduction histidine kinase